MSHRAKMKKTPFNIYSDILLTNGYRIPLIADWLMNSVWSMDNYSSKENKMYLEEGKNKSEILKN
jgi:hypothetical protein